MVGHIDAVVKRYAERIEVWDAVNEGLNDDGTGYRENVFFEALGPEYIDEAFRAARVADATLLYKDFDIGCLSLKSDRAFELVTDLQNRGIPLDGVGMQMHIDHTFARAEGFSSNMQRVADRGLEIWITEFDVAVLQLSDCEQQGVVYKDFIRRCLMQPIPRTVPSTAWLWFLVPRMRKATTLRLPR